MTTDTVETVACCTGCGGLLPKSGQHRYHDLYVKLSGDAAEHDHENRPRLFGFCCTCREEVFTFAADHLGFAGDTNGSECALCEGDRDGFGGSVLLSIRETRAHKYVNVCRDCDTVVENFLTDAGEEDAADPAFAAPERPVVERVTGNRLYRQLAALDELADGDRVYIAAESKTPTYPQRAVTLTATLNGDPSDERDFKYRLTEMEFEASNWPGHQPETLSLTECRTASPPHLELGFDDHIFTDAPILGFSGWVTELDTVAPDQ